MATKFLVLFLVCGQTLAYPSQSQKTRQAVEVLVTETRSLESPYEVSLTAFDQPIQLRLARPQSSIFTEGFTFGTTSVLKSQLAPLEENIFVDTLNKASLKIERHPTGHKIKGFIKGMGINHENGQHFVTPHSHNELENWCGVKEEHYHPMPEAHMPAGAQNIRQAGAASIEVQVVFDTAQEAVLGSRDNITEYAAVMFHAVNAIYEDMSNPSMQAKIAGIYVLTAAEDQRIIQDTGNDINDELSVLRTWVGESPTGLGPSDVVALLTGLQTKDKDISNPNSHTLGLAYCPGLCGKSRESVNQDVGAAWDAVYTIAHEIGHNMGAKHDFDPSVECGEGGFIMGYKPGTTNYFHFSECSKTMIRNAIQSQGACVFTNDAGAGVSTGSTDPGQVPAMTMEFQCNKKKAWRSPELKDIQLIYRPEDNPPNQVCTKLICNLPPGYVPQPIPQGTPAEGSNCNQSGGKCHQGLCV